MKPYQLPKEFATKWVAALRSGEYKQGRGVYYNSSEGCYCSMGVGLVANDIPLNERGDNTLSDHDPIMECISSDEKPTTLWYNIYKLNDEKNLSFTQIANWIETNVEFI